MPRVPLKSKQKKPFEGAAQGPYNTRRWRTLSAWIRRRDPICKICNRKPSEETDHIVPYAVDPELFFNPDNCRGVCKKCHQVKTSKSNKISQPATGQVPPLP